MISEEGQLSLSESGLWIQILDENNQEVQSFNKPENVETKYTPMDLINGYKYGGGIDGKSEILVGEKELQEHTYTYMIGYSMKHLRKYTLIFSNDTIMENVNGLILPIIFLDVIAAFILGYLFSIRLTKPVKQIVTGIGELAEEKPMNPFKGKGIYRSVFSQINYLSQRLKENEKERIHLQKMRVEWIANISHDIKTPLASIKGYAELMDGEYEFTKEEIQRVRRNYPDQGGVFHRVGGGP